MTGNEIIKKTDRVTDLTGLIEMMGGKKHLIKDIIYAFLKQIPEELDSLNTAVINSDYATIKSTAHTMMSSVLIVGISELSTVLLEIETLGSRSTDIERIKELQKKVISVCGLAIKEIESEVHTYV